VGSEIVQPSKPGRDERAVVAVRDDQYVMRIRDDQIKGDAFVGILADKEQ
jgi:hypothetical protein